MYFTPRLNMVLNIYSWPTKGSPPAQQKNTVPRIQRWQCWILKSKKDPVLIFAQVRKCASSLFLQCLKAKPILHQNTWNGTKYLKNNTKIGKILSTNHLTHDSRGSQIGVGDIGTILPSTWQSIEVGGRDALEEGVASHPPDWGAKQQQETGHHWTGRALPASSG